MAMDWRTAYFQQARSDYDMLLRLLKEENVPECQRLHYLQMATEKLAKGFLTQPGGPRYPKVHDAFVRFVKSLLDLILIYSALADLRVIACLRLCVIWMACAI